MHRKAQPTPKAAPAVEAATTPSVPAKQPQRRAIDAQTIDELAKLVAIKFSDRQACLTVGVNPQTFAKWKCTHRNDTRFTDAMERYRAAKLKANLENVENASVGKGGHRPDWRASAWMTERVLSSDGRFGDRITVESTNHVSIYQQLAPDIEKTIARAYDRTKQAQVEDAPTASPPEQRQLVCDRPWSPPRTTPKLPPPFIDNDAQGESE